MYVIVENGKALIIDPSISEDAKKYLKSEKIEDILILLTHEHYDHISGVNWFKEEFTKTKLLCSEPCAKALPKPYKNLSVYYEILFSTKDPEIREYVRNMDVQPYSCEADEFFTGEKEFEWQGHKIYMKETPGHSKGSCCIFWENECMFSGDTLVTGHDTILRLPGGNRKDFAEKTLPFLHSLDRELLVYPGHGEPQKLFHYFE